MEDGQPLIVAELLFNNEYIQYNESIYLTYILQQLQSTNDISKCNIEDVSLEVSEITYMDILIDNYIHNTITDKSIIDLLINKVTTISFDVLFVSLVKTTLTVQSPFNGQLFQIFYNDDYYVMNLKKKLNFRDKMVIKSFIKEIRYEMLGNNNTLIIILEQTKNIKIINDRYENKLYTYSYSSYKEQQAINKQNYIILEGKSEVNYIDSLVVNRDKQLRQYLQLFKIQYQDDYNADLSLYHNKFMLELYFKCKNDQDENTNKSHYDELEIEDDLLSKRLRNNTVEDDQPS